jgi:hypothetical protein
MTNKTTLNVTAQINQAYASFMEEVVDSDFLGTKILRKATYPSGEGSHILEFCAGYQKGQASVPVLMSADNHHGWKLEELAAQLREEIYVKSGKIQDDTRHQAQHVLRNNQRIIDMLLAIESLQRDSFAVMATLGKDQGPTGNPRIGVEAGQALIAAMNRVADDKL